MFKKGAIDKAVACEAIDSILRLVEKYDSEMANATYPEVLKEKALEEYEGARAVIKKYAEQIHPQTLENMQKKYYAITNMEDYLQNHTQAFVVQNFISTTWDGIGPWKH